MESSQQTQAKNKKQSYVGVIGFALGMAGICSFGLTALPGFVLCLIGIFRKSYRVLSWIGLFVCLFGLLLPSVWTPPGTIPYPLSVAKYCLNAPSFWVNYDVLRLRKAQSQYWFFGGAGGALYFRANKAETFDPNEVIAFAEKHNWHFQNRTRLTKDDFDMFLNEKGHVIWLDEGPYLSGVENVKDYDQAIKIYERDNQKTSLLRGMTMFPGGFTLWIQQDCDVLSFDTGNRIGASSHVVINRDGTEMAVYYDGSR